ncbi:MAG TPA: pilus (MSHA type) biogenesis protein MshL [Rhodanobacteraceae bacterium]|nr:pilus (MSHA type) biogenesis protein MshL [Rhodanobacteraceae bacterium]
MTKQATPATRRHGGIRLVRGVLVIGLTTLLISGCANMLPRNSTKGLPPVDHDTLPKAATDVAAESAMLASTHDKLVAQINKAPSPAALPPVQPVYDPLENKVVTIRMYDASVSSLLWAMSDQLGMNLILDPRVQAMQQRATLNLTNVTAREVFNHILQAFDLHGEVHGRTLFVKMMEEKIYKLDFLNTRMNVDISDGGNVFGAEQGAQSGGSQGGGGAGGGSGGGSGGGGANSLRSNFAISGGMTTQKGMYQQIEDGLKTVLGDSTAAQNRVAHQGQEDFSVPEPSIYSLNAHTGTLYVRARPSEIRSVDKMVNQFKDVMGRQVQIDAQLIDVQLSDGFQFGVDWNLMRSYVAGIAGDAPMVLSQATRQFPGGEHAGLPPRTITIPDQLIGNTDGRSIGLAYGDDKFSAAVNMLRSFGNVKVLSNPSIRVRNGAPAILSVGTNIRYLSSSASTISNPGGGANTISTNAQTDALFSGLMVGVVPFIHEDGTVELLVHPVQSEVDPSSLQLVDAGGGTRVSLPVTSFKGMTTTLNVEDGATVMIGGLIDQKLSSDRNGVPGVADIPVLGRLFDKSVNSHKSRELVMVIRVKVL